jgi:hypothetical protein
MLQNRPVGPRLQVCGLQILSLFRISLSCCWQQSCGSPSLAARHALGACRVMTTVRSQSADPIVEHEGPSPCLQKPVTDPYLETPCIQNTALGLHTSLISILMLPFHPCHRLSPTFWHFPKTDVCAEYFVHPRVITRRSAGHGGPGLLLGQSMWDLWRQTGTGTGGDITPRIPNIHSFII